MAIEDVDLRVRDRPPNGNGPWISRDRMKRGPDGGFGGPVHVQDFSESLKAFHQRSRQRLPAKEKRFHLAHSFFCVGIIQHGGCERTCALQVRYAVPRNLIGNRKSFGTGGTTPWKDFSNGAGIVLLKEHLETAGQGPEEFKHGDIK